MRYTILVLPLVSGCAIVLDGPSFDHEAARSVAVGTTAEDLLRTIGEPQDVVLQDDGSEKWLYRYKRSFGASLVILSVSNTRTRSAVYYLRNGAVERIGTLSGPVPPRKEKRRGAIGRK